MARISYTADTTAVFPNPERGWFFQYSPPCCDDVPNGVVGGPHPPVGLAELQALRDGPDAMTLARDVVKIQQYEGDIPQARLDEIRADLDTVREAGLKVIWRIQYNTSNTAGNPPPEVISRHLDQLGPVLRDNADVVFSVELGLFGSWGEACCRSDLILDSPGNNNGFSSLTPSAVELYEELLSFIPETRNVAVRYPCYKYQLMGWADSATEQLTDYPSAVEPLTADTAFDGSLQARLGFSQDNFAGDELGYGFFYAWEDRDVDFVTADTEFALMQGELSIATDHNKEFGPQELERDHYSAFHARNAEDSAGYEGWDEVSAAWRASGQYDRIAAGLGYRFRLVDAEVPTSVPRSGPFTMSLTMSNDGWARIMNPRNVEIVLRERSTGATYPLVVDGDGRGNRLWLPGPGESKDLVVSQPLPPDLPVGDYELFLHLADPAPLLHDRPEYSIRLANEDIWRPDTGYNDLRAVVAVADT
ncbi:MAG TPA: DUF4832 domain-containing protein [Pseudonocardia sp.]|nr:DUF4832 domain-containing protein [Pseudonocardia sp.]